MFESDRFDVFLDAPSQLVLIAPGIETGDVGGDGFEVVDNARGEVGDIFCDGLGDGCVEIADSKGKVSKLVLRCVVREAREVPL